VSDSYERIRAEWSQLTGQWRDTRKEWQDSVAARFEKEYWAPWEDQFPKLLSELKELEETIDKAFRHLN
jgi:hypothetical protein